MRRVVAAAACGALLLLILLVQRTPPPRVLSPHPSHAASTNHSAAASHGGTSHGGTSHGGTSHGGTSHGGTSHGGTNIANTNAISHDAKPAANIASKRATNTTTTTKHPGVILTRDLYESGHSSPHPELCPNLGAKIKLLILVTSAPAHAPQRTAVRLTWGHFAARSDVALGFMLGTPPETLRDKIEQEDSLYGDIIIGNFLDSYSNLTLKSLSLLEWTATYCPRTPFVLKTDDDMFINIPRLLSFAAARTNASRTLYGKVLKKSYPKRTPHAKYYLSVAQYPGKVLPNFATGPAYLLTADCVPLLVRAAPGQPYVRLEDVFITGILANKAGIKRVSAGEFVNRRVSPHACAVQRAVALHMVKYHEQFDLWRKLLDGKTKCT